MLNIVNDMNIKKLQELIDGKKITKAFVIKETGITRPSLDSILMGNDFKVSNLEKLAKVLKVPVGYFFDEEFKIEAYTATGPRGVVAKNINSIDQRDCNLTSEKDLISLQNQLDDLKTQLLDARAEIINLMKKER